MTITEADGASTTGLKCVCTYDQANHQHPSAHCAGVPRQYRVGEHGHGALARLSVQAVREAGLSDCRPQEVRYWRMDLSRVRRETEGEIVENINAISREKSIPWLLEELIECDGFRLCYTNTKLTGIVARLPGGRAVPIADLMRNYRVVMPRSIRNN